MKARLLRWLAPVLAVLWTVWGLFLLACFIAVILADASWRWLKRRLSR